MTYIAIATFVKEDRVISELASRRKGYHYPPAFKNVTSYMDVQGGRVITTFETDDVASIMIYSASFPDVTFDIFPVVPTDQAWEIYLARKK